MAHARKRFGSEPLLSSTAESDCSCVREVPVRFPARDGYLLEGTLYVDDRCERPADVVVFSTGGGIAARRYRHFLRFLAGAGLPTLAYDYRGVGRSAPAGRQGFDAGIEDWADLDQPAAIDFLRGRFPAARLASVSHSIGCLVAAAAPNARTLHQMVFIAPHTGYWGDYRQPWRWPMALMWHVAMPLVARAIGYFPASWFGLGDDFPRRVALQWAGRLKPGLRDSPLVPALAQEAFFGRTRSLALPALLITVSKDAFVGDLACGRFVHLFSELRVVRRHLETSHFSKGKATHTSFFRRSNAGLWGAVSRFVLTSIGPQASSRHPQVPEPCDQ